VTYLSHTELDKETISKAYARWAPVYDLVFGAVFERGREAAVAAAERVGGRILEVGIGTGMSLADYSRSSRICGIDISEPMLRKAQERVAELGLSNVEGLWVMDAEHLTFPDNSFDVIYCSHVLEHVPEDRKAMRELARVLKPTGWAVLAVPVIRDKTFEDPKITSPADRLRVYGQEDHVRAYGQDFADRLRESGFDVTVDPFARGLSEEMVQRYGLSREDIYFCRKHPIR
jgi:ubiquinone/menaquinone biosynthesis C-methylase UbiE